MITQSKPKLRGVRAPDKPKTSLLATQTLTPPAAFAFAPFEGVLLRLRPLTVQEYDRLIEIEIIREEEPVELVEGYIQRTDRLASPDNAISALRDGYATFLRRFTIPEYDRMIATGIIGEHERVELLQGMIVIMSALNPPHSVAIELIEAILPPVVPGDWYIRCQLPIITAEGEPQPDFAVVRGPRRRYTKRHPTRSDIALIGEIADSSLAVDRQVMGMIYARERIPIYWIINLPDSQIEVYTVPTVDGSGFAYYKSRQDYGPKELVPLIIRSRTVRKIRVRDLLP